MLLRHCCVHNVLVHAEALPRLAATQHQRALLLVMLLARLLFLLLATRAASVLELGADYEMTANSEPDVVALSVATFDEQLLKSKHLLV